MNDIYSLIQCLTSREWESLQAYLTCFSTHAEDEGGLKQLQLAKVLREATDCPSQARCSLRVYGKKEVKGFDMLKSRLKEKIFDFVLTDITVDKQRQLDEADYAIIQMKKKSAQFQQLYYSKSRMPLLYGLLDDIISLATEYEHYFILLEHLKAKKNLVSWKLGEKAFEKINEQMEYYSLCSKYAAQAEHLYFKLFMQSEYTGKADKKKIISFLENAIEEVKEGFRITKSANVNYHLKNLEMGYAELQGNYSQARSICLELLNIVRNNKSVYRKQRIGIVYDHLSHYEYYIGNLEESLKSAREAQLFFNLNSDNYCIAVEQEFYATLAMKKYSASVELAKKCWAALPVKS